MLTQYLQRTMQYLNDIKIELFNPAFLTSYVNTARGQIAGEAECIRFSGALPTVIGTQTYPFTGISLSGSTGVQGVLHVRSLWFAAGAGQQFIHPRNFAWFSVYELNTAAPTPGPPSSWSQFGQGANGTFYLNVPPDAVYALTADCVCSPIPLVDDTTPEAIPYQWTDAVPFFAAYLAYTQAQQHDAAKMMKGEYSDFVMRARRTATPGVLPGSYEQTGNPVRGNQLGIQQARGQAA